MQKAFWKSKTILFNVLFALVAAVAAYQGQIEELWGREAYLYALLGSVIINIVLRSVTTEGVGLRDQGK